MSNKVIRAAERRLADPYNDFFRRFAAPVNLCWVPKARRLALGLVLPAAPQLVDSLRQREGSPDINLNSSHAGGWCSPW